MTRPAARPPLPFPSITALSSVYISRHITIATTSRTTSGIINRSQNNLHVQNQQAQLEEMVVAPSSPPPVLRSRTTPTREHVVVAPPLPHQAHTPFGGCCTQLAAACAPCHMKTMLEQIVVAPRSPPFVLCCRTQPGSRAATALALPSARPFRTKPTSELMAALPMSRHRRCFAAARIPPSNSAGVSGVES